MLQSFRSTSILFVLAALAFGTGVYAQKTTRELLQNTETVEGVVEKVAVVDWDGERKAHVPVVAFERDGETKKFAARPRPAPMFQVGDRVTVVLPPVGSDRSPLVREEIEDLSGGLYALGAVMTVIAFAMFGAAEIGRRRKAARGSSGVS